MTTAQLIFLHLGIGAISVIISFVLMVAFDLITKETNEKTTKMEMLLLASISYSLYLVLTRLIL